MKTSIDIDDVLLARVRNRARRDRVTIKQLVENGLRLVLQEESPVTISQRFVWPVAQGMQYPLNAMSVNELIGLLREEASERVMGQKLIMEHEMGELFKVIGLCRGAPWDALGFTLGDRTHTL